MLKPLAEGLWSYEFDQFMPGGMHFPGRMTVARLADGGLWLHSPGPVTDAVAESLDALGPVKHIVAPNRLHHLHLPSATERFPEAAVHGAPGLAAKRKDVSFDAELGGVAPEAWRGQFDQLVIEGNPLLNEVVFLHRPSRTLIVADLAFNIQESKGWVAPVVLRMVGAWRKPAQSRVWRLTTRDRAAAGGSVRSILDWDFDRLVMAHGTPIEAGAREQLAPLLGWMVKGLPPRLTGGADQG